MRGRTSIVALVLGLLLLGGPWSRLPAADAPPPVADLAEAKLKAARAA
jgi:hypothetical protein